MSSRWKHYAMARDMYKKENNDHTCVVIVVIFLIIAKIIWNLIAD